MPGMPEAFDYHESSRRIDVKVMEPCALVGRVALPEHRWRVLKTVPMGFRPVPG